MTWMREVKDIFDDQLEPNAITCCCLGPQDGEPVCPCAMRSVFIKDGRYKQIIDLGPVDENK